MNNLYFKASDSNPEVNFNLDGNLSLKGEAFPEDTATIFDPMIYWIKRLKVENVNLSLNLIHCNTAVLKQLFDVLFSLQENKEIQKTNIKWFYEESDLDSLETGMIYSETLKELSFKFCEYANAS